MAAQPDDKTLTLKEMVRRAGSTPRTIRFYEEVGLIHPLGRSPGGHRLYHPSELEKLQLIGDLRIAGFSLDEIKTIFELRQRRHDAKQASGEVSKILTEKIDQLKRRLGALVQLKEELASSVDLWQTACADCKCPPGEEICEACADIDHAHLPRTFRWIWNVH